MHKVKLYALSTCAWCRKTKRFFNLHNVDYEFVDVDLLGPVERQQVLEEVARWNPRLSFPTVVVDDREVVVGYDEVRLREVLGL
ncbi:MAG: glutaredoxin family protein [Anaerolineae bacterium]